MKKILLSSAIAMLILTGCGEDKKTTAVEVSKQDVIVEQTQTTTVEQTQTTTVAQEAAKMVESVSKEKIVAKIEEIKETANEIVSKKNVTEIKDTVKEAVSNTTEVVAAKLADTVEAVKVMAEPIKEEAVPVVDGKALFGACAGCHGLNAEKQALGKSQIIKGWDEQKTIDALNGYKDGSYGGAMKGIMKGQVVTKSPEEIKALASFISNL